MRLPSLFLISVGAVGLALTGCSDEQVAEPPAPRAARVAVVAPQRLALVAEGAGQIQSRYVSAVGFEVAGRLSKREVDIGAIVRKGQRLAQLSAVDYQNRVSAAEADLSAAIAAKTQAAAQENRRKILLGKGFTTQSQYEEALKVLQSAQAAVEAAEANLRIARNQLDYTQLLAPDDGIVTATGADPGQVVAAGQMVIEISRNDALEAVFAVASEDIIRAQVGLPVSISLQGHPDVLATGTIREIAPQADNATGTYLVKVALTTPPAEMRLGAVVVGRVESHDGEDVTVLPSSALLQSADHPQVWVVGAEGKVQRRKVEIREFEVDSIVVSKGLSTGEKVVVAGVNSLAEGQIVNPQTEVE